VSGKLITFAAGFFSLSPDGRWLAISDNNLGKLLLVPASGRGAEETLIEDVSRYVPHGVIATSSSPDGRAMAFAAEVDSKDPPALYILRTDGSVTKVPNTGKVFTPAWRPR
jgi:Tol biopolymer transport system component